MKRVTDSELDYPGNDGRYHYEGKPFEGIVIDMADDGFVESEQEFRDGVPWGIGKSWYRNGCLASESHWLGGTQHGHHREWSEGGQLTLEEEFEFGVCKSKKLWNEAGERLGEYRLKEDDPAYKQLETLRVRFSERDQTGRSPSNS